VQVQKLIAVSLQLSEPDTDEFAMKFLYVYSYRKLFVALILGVIQFSLISRALEGTRNGPLCCENS